MTDPTPERIAAALKLADTCDEFNEKMGNGEYAAALKAYRATLPKLRTRAEVDAEIARAFRRYMLTESGELTTVGTSDDALWTQLENLVAEPTAPEPAAEADRRKCGRCGESAYDAVSSTCLNCGADEPAWEPEACGCEEAEALKDQITELRRLLGHAYQTAAELAKALETTP